MNEAKFTIYLVLSSLLWCGIGFCMLVKITDSYIVIASAIALLYATNRLHSIPDEKVFLTYTVGNKILIASGVLITRLFFIIIMVLFHYEAANSIKPIFQPFVFFILGAIWVGHISSAWYSMVAITKRSSSCCAQDSAKSAEPLS